MHISICVLNLSCFYFCVPAIDSAAPSQAASGEASTASGESDCAICLLPCTLPLSLPCGHTFCYLCAKGIAFRSRRCALCRETIPDDVIAKPHIDLENASLPHTAGASSKVADDEADDCADQDAVWYYEGHNGWWQYEPRTNREIEQAYNAEKKSCEVLIAGFVYAIDLENMCQARRSQNTRRRRICRNLSPSAVRKGVAGVPFESSEKAEEKK